MGHATRDISIIKELLNYDFEIVIGVTKNNIAIFEIEFPNLRTIFLPEYNIKYSKRNSQILIILLSIPRILLSILRENIRIKKINKNEKFDIIISDNRFGLRNKKAYNIYITHQLFIKVPEKVKFTEKIINRINKLFINKFDELWIPDFENNENLSGELTHINQIHKNQHFIGVLSRFDQIQNHKNENNFERDILFILSGPEPQRSIFEKIVLNQIIKSNYTALIAAAKPELKFENQLNERIKIVWHLTSAEMQKAILTSRYIISRSGYCTLADLYSLKKTAIIVPTPGQTEQEYLAEYLTDKRQFYSINQNDFDLEKSINNLNNFSISKSNENISNLAKIIKQLFEK